MPGKVQMRSLRSLRDDASAAKPILAVIVGILVVTSTVGAYVLIFNDSSGDPVTTGDRIRVDYIGKFDDGRVFDTSIWDVASDNDTHPKSLFFTHRGSGSAYSPMEFTVGAGNMITGFDLGVRGMSVGDSRTFKVSVAQGYGEMDSSMCVTRQLNETLDLESIMDKETFKATYGEDPFNFKPVTHLQLGLPAYVKFYDSVADKVVVSFAVDTAVGDKYRAFADSNGAYGWDVVVTDINSTSITIKHQLTENDNFNIRGYGSAGISSYDPYLKKMKPLHDFYVDSIDEVAGTFVLNYNPEIVGHELTFEVTILSRA
ncbi:MAG: FKBP-type peptidyl-prolyl cis-trans isomerase [Euryarchaeota archaeon]|nr:FKBP-type peptidyl-prolyl cis-trans isomerase [Euryarchaeota archaeon]